VSYVQHLPLIKGSGDPSAPTGQDDATDYDLALARLIATHAEQSGACRARVLTWHTTLARVARARANDMATRGYFSHTDPDGLGPNAHVRAAGYALPDWYGQEPAANNVESIGAGYATAADAFAGWLASPAHRTHILGLIDFYCQQTNFGIGYAFRADSPLKHYWCYISAP
jgi:uncharacterized protein YkwD